MRELSVVLGLVLMVMAGAIVAVWVGQDGVRVGAPGTTSPARSASPTSVAGSLIATASPPITSSPDAPPTATDEPTAATTASPVPTDAAPSPTAGESPTTAPTDGASVPQRGVALLDVGLDTAGTGDEEPPQPRYISFVVDGSGQIEARISDVSFGRVRMCLWRGELDAVQPGNCQTLRRGTLTGEAAGAAPETWNLSLIGSQAGASPSADVAVSWPASVGRLSLDGFRFQGQEIQNYNGFEMEVATFADGELSVAATFDDGSGGEYPWLLEIDAHEFAFADEGRGSGMRSGTPVVNGLLYAVTLSNREAVSDQRVLLSAEVDWP